MQVNDSISLGQAIRNRRKALLDSAEELSKTGFTEAQSMAENILGKILR